MRKIIKRLSLCIILVFAFVLPQGTVHAADFANNEAYYNNLCNNTQTNKGDSETCKAYAQYLRDKSSSIKSEISDLNNKIDTILGDMNAVMSALNSIESTINELNTMIEENIASIAVIQESIDVLVVEMEQTQKDIDVRDDQIKERMRSEQSSVGTNVYMDFIMGANDLMDLIRTLEGIQRITENDQEQITALQEDKDKLEVQKSEQVRLQDDVIAKKEDNEKSKEQQISAKEAQEKLLASYQQQEADLNEQMRSAQSKQEATDHMIQSIVDASNVGGNANWTFPVLGGYKSAGTWYYPGGGGPVGVHLGMDIAAGVGTSLVAPANSVVLYANNPAPTNGGYLGNWVGYPSGGGNTVQLLMEIQGITYAVSFFHLAQENFTARAGQVLSAGQRFGGVGNSGNSTGAHCHIEIVKLGSIGLVAGQQQFQSHRDFAWGTGWGGGALSRTCAATGGATPCRERPEDILY